MIVGRGYHASSAPVATAPSPSCVARELTDFGRAVGRYDGEGAIATCRGRVAVRCDLRSTREGRTCCDRAEATGADAMNRVPPVATYPPNEVSRASGRKRGAPPPSRQLAGRYDGEGAIATCRGRVAVLCDRWPTREGRACRDRCPHVVDSDAMNCVPP